MYKVQCSPDRRRGRNDEVERTDTIGREFKKTASLGAQSIISSFNFLSRGTFRCGIILPPKKIWQTK